jgi:chromo domain-containing protein 1
MLRKSRDEDEDDAISIMSTQSEEYSSGEEFLVERVLAEKRDSDNKALYLISWAEYPEEQSTWEPRKNIQDPAILEAWEERKGQEALGAQPAFDLASFDARIAEIERARVERHQRRKAKRRRRGIPVSSSEDSEFDEAYDSDSSEAVEANELPEDEPVARKKSLQRPRSQNVARTRRRTEFDSSAIQPPFGQPNHSQWEEESDSSDLDRDLLVGDKKKAQQKALQSIRQKRATQNVSKASRDAGEPATVNPLQVSSIIPASA